MAGTKQVGMQNYNDSSTSEEEYESCPSDMDYYCTCNDAVVDGSVNKVMTPNEESPQRERDALYESTPTKRRSSRLSKMKAEKLVGLNVAKGSDNNGTAAIMEQFTIPDGRDAENNFREKAIDLIKKPFDNDEYKMLLERVKSEKYLDQHPDLRKVLSQYRYQRRTRLAILRGYFFWFQNSSHDGAFKPWNDSRFLAVVVLIDNQGVSDQNPGPSNDNQATINQREDDNRAQSSNTYKGKNVVTEDHAVITRVLLQKPSPKNMLEKRNKDAHQARPEENYEVQARSTDNSQDLGDPSEYDLDFRTRVLGLISDPYDEAEYKRHQDAVRAGNFLHLYRDLGRILEKYQYNQRKCLAILRGFFFWRQNGGQEGAFKPWNDDQCLDVQPPSP